MQILQQWADADLAVSEGEIDVCRLQVDTLRQQTESHFLPPRSLSLCSLFN